MLAVIIIGMVLSNFDKTYLPDFGTVQSADILHNSIIFHNSSVQSDEKFSIKFQQDGHFYTGIEVTPVVFCRQLILTAISTGGNSSVLARMSVSPSRMTSESCFFANLTVKG